MDLIPARRPLHVAAALAGLTFVLGLVRSGNKSLWFDEAVSAEFAGRTLRGLLPEITGGDPNMAFYYALLNLWRRLFGDGEVALRSLSALAAAGAVTALFVLGTRLFGPRAGLFAAVLLAFNAFLIEYAQMARGYTLLALLVTLSSWRFVVELERPSLGGRVVYVLVSALAVYTHYFAALVLVAQLCALLALRRRFAITPGRVAVAVALVALGVPVVVFARAGGTARISWIPPLSHLSVPIAIVKLAGRSFVLAALFGFSAAWAAWQIATSWRLRDDVEKVWRLGFVLAWLVIPFGIAIAVSFRRPVLLAQYLIVCLPALCLLTSVALKGLKPARVGTALLALFVVLSAVRLVELYRTDGLEDWRSTERNLARAIQPGDRTAFFPRFAGKAYEYYARRNGRAAGSSRDNAGVDSTRRVWLVLRDSDALRRSNELSRLRAELGAGRRRTEHARFPGISVELFER